MAGLHTAFMLGALAAVAPAGEPARELPFVEIRHSKEVLGVAVGPNGALGASGDNAGTVLIWDRETGKILQELKGHASHVSSIRFTTDGRWLFSGGYDHAVRRFDLRTGRQDWVSKEQGQTIYAIRVSPDGARVASATTKDTWVRDTKTLKTIQILPLGDPVTFSPDGVCLAGEIGRNRLALYHVKTKRELWQVKVDGNVASAVFSPDGSAVVIGLQSGEVAVFNAKDGRLRFQVVAHEKSVRGLAVSPDSRLIATGSWDTSVKLLAFDDGKELLTLSRHTDLVLSVKFTSDGLGLVTGARDSRAIRWDLFDWRVARGFPPLGQGSKPATAAELDAAWGQLTGKPGEAYRAARVFAQAGEASARYLLPRVPKRRAKKPDKKEIDRWIVRLADSSERLRRRARARLREYGLDAEEALRAVKRPPEALRAARSILKGMAGVHWPRSPEEWRWWRLIGALRRVQGRTAMQVIRALAELDSAPLADAARRALRQRRNVKQARESESCARLHPVSGLLVPMRAAFMLLLVAALAWTHGSTADMPPPSSGPTPGAGAPPPTATPGGGGPGTGGGSGGGGPTTSGGGGGGTTLWRLWWRLNRERVVGLRRLLRERTSATRSLGAGPVDPVADMRPDILAALRRVARRAEDRTLRAAAVLSLGRAGNAEDVPFFLELATRDKTRSVVREAAIVALGIVGDVGQRAPDLRDFFQQAAAGKVRLPNRAAGLALLAAGLRGRQDPTLLLALLGRIQVAKLKTQEEADLAFSLGLTGNAMAVPDLIRAVRRGRLGRHKLSPLARAHAAQALGLIEVSGRLDHLVALLRSRRARVAARQSAALAIGRILRETDPPLPQVERARDALLKTFEKARDQSVRAFCALALGGGRAPFGVETLRKSFADGADVQIRPVCALALGLAARTYGPRDGAGHQIRAFLAKRYSRAKNPDLKSALAIALGLAGANEAAPDLMSVLRRRSAPPKLRGAAAQGLGLLRGRNPEVLDTLQEIARKTKKPALLEDVAIALGLSRRRAMALELVKLMQQTNSALAQGRIALALGHMDHGGTVRPLLEILLDKRERTSVREFSAVALALMADRRPHDALFDVEAWFNPFATSIASHELIRLY